MAEIFRMPKMGQTLTEATVLKWLKSEGDSVESWEEVVEVMTDKIDMGVEALIKGTILKILAPVGAVVPLGGPMAVIGEAGEDISELLATLDAESPAADASKPRSEPLAPGHAAAAAAAVPAATASASEIPAVSPRAREAATAAGVDWRSLSVTGSGFDGMIVERDIAGLASSPQATPRLTPLAAKVAAEMGVSGAGVAGTGPGGRVTAGDLRRTVAVAGRSALIEAREIPVAGMRRIVADRLVSSWITAPHVPLRLRVDMSACRELRSQLKPVLEERQARLTYTDIIAAAIARALVQHPILNATLEDSVVRIHPHVNLGIAVALDDGLTVPVLKQAEQLSLPEISRRAGELARDARAGALGLADYQDGTITLSNLGQWGVESFDPILNPPQVAIIGTGAIRDEVCAVDGRAEIRPVMSVCVTFDHRAMDGAPASAFLATLKDLLENPARLLL